MQYLFDTPIPIPWLMADLLTLAITLLVVLAGVIHWFLFPWIYIAGGMIKTPLVPFVLEP